jgi:hypothetical protein
MHGAPGWPVAAADGDRLAGSGAERALVGRPAVIDEIDVVATLADDDRPPERQGGTHWAVRLRSLLF